MKMNNWEKPEVSNQYVESINSDPDNEINITKKFYHDPFFSAQTPDLSGKTVLDIGCGDGYMVKELGEKYPDAKLLGLDLPNMVEQTRKTPHPSNVEFVGASCYALPFEDNAIDTVISSLMGHWVEDFGKMTEEMYRVLKPNGDLIISFIHPYTFKVGRWENLDTDNPEYIQTEDISKAQNFDVYINRTVGPVTYYMRPLDYYEGIFKTVGFSDVNILQPVVNDEQLFQSYPGLKKYKKHPLYLVVKARK